MEFYIILYKDPLLSSPGKPTPIFGVEIGQLKITANTKKTVCDFVATFLVYTFVCKTILIFISFTNKWEGYSYVCHSGVKLANFQIQEYKNISKIISENISLPVSWNVIS